MLTNSSLNLIRYLELDLPVLTWERAIIFVDRAAKNYLPGYEGERINPPTKKKFGVSRDKASGTYFLGLQEEKPKSTKETLRNRSLLYNKLDIQCQNTRQQPPTAANPQYLQKQ